MASILQALAARRSAAVEGLDPRLLLRLLHSWQYLVGLALDGLAFLLSIAALRSLPLFAVQAIVASFLAITAVLGAVFLHMPLRRSDKIGVAVVILGLVLVGLSAAEDDAVAIGSAVHWGVLVVAVALGALAVPAALLSGPIGVAALGAIAGLAFGAVAVGARILVVADHRTRGAHRPGHVRSAGRRRRRVDDLFDGVATRLGHRRDGTAGGRRDRRTGPGRTVPAG